MAYLLANDGVSGKAGSAFMVKNGRNIELFGIKKFEANAIVHLLAYSALVPTDTATET